MFQWTVFGVALSVEVRWFVPDEAAPDSMFDKWLMLPVETVVDTYVSYSYDHAVKVFPGGRWETQVKLSTMRWEDGGIVGRRERWVRDEVVCPDPVDSVGAVEVESLRRYRNGVELAWVRADGYEPMWTISARLEVPEAQAELGRLAGFGSLNIDYAMSYPEWLTRRMKPR